MCDLNWRTIPLDENSDSPNRRMGHTFVYLNDQEKFLIFGGEIPERKKDVWTYSISKYKLKFDNNTWKLEFPSGEPPKNVAYCIGWYDAPYLFIHGGRNDDSPSNCTFFLDTSQMVWKKVFTMDQPIARYYHACAKTNNKEIFIFGGFNEKKNNNFGDLHKFDYNNLQFDSHDWDRVGGSYWNLIYDSGQKPTGRRGHQMAFYKGKIFVYGGITNKGLDDEQLYQYTIENRQWKIIKLNGNSLGKRVFHSMNFLKENTLVIYGGKIKLSESDFEASNDMFIVDLEEMKCEVVNTGNDRPFRFNHVSCYNVSFSPTFYCILGGSDSKELSEFNIHFISDKEFLFVENEKEKIENRVNEELLTQILENNEEIKSLETKSNRIQTEIKNLNKQYAFNKKQSLEDKLLAKLTKKNRIEISKESKDLNTISRELKEYNNYLDIINLISKNKFVMISEFLDDILKTIRIFDEWLVSVEKTPSKIFYFANVDLNSIIDKRKEMKTYMEGYREQFKQFIKLEQSINLVIQAQSSEQIEAFSKQEILIGEEKKSLSFRDPIDYLNDSIDA